MENLVLSCRSCNHLKMNALPGGAWQEKIPVRPAKTQAALHLIEITAAQAALAMDISPHVVRNHIRDGRLKGRQNRLTKRMWTTPQACIDWIRAECGTGSPEETNFRASLKKK